MTADQKVALSTKVCSICLLEKVHEPFTPVNPMGGKIRLEPMQVREVELNAAGIRSVTGPPSYTNIRG